MVQARALPAGTKEEKLIRKQAVADAKLGVRCRKAAAKYFPNGIPFADEEKLDSLIETERELDEKKVKLLKEKAPKAEVEAVSAELAAVSKEIKKLSDEGAKIAECTKVYTDACKLLRQAANYEKFGEIDRLYSEKLLPETEI